MRADIEAAKLASERAAATLHRKLGRGRASLAAIAGSAALIGLLRTLYDLRLIGLAPEPPPLFCGSREDPSEAVIYTLVGLCVTIVAIWVHGYIRTQLELFDTEMRVAILELATVLSSRK